MTRLLNIKKQRILLQKIKTVDFSKAIKDLNHNPVVDPYEGIKRTTDWMKNYYQFATHSIGKK